MVVAKKNDKNFTQLIMVIHENEIYNKTITKFLSQNGFETLSASTLDETKQNLQTKSCDAILVDALSKNFDALLVSELARISPLNRNAKVYILGEKTDPMKKSIASQLQEKQPLTEPLNLTQLLNTLKSDVLSPETAYDVRIINAFVEAATEVYQFYFNMNPERSKLSFRDQGHPENSYCTGVIALIGDGLHGSLGVGMTAPAVKVVAESLFRDIALVFDNDFIGDITGEMCNQVLGRAKVNCGKFGVNINIGLPKIYVGKSHIVKHTVPGSVVSIMIGHGISSFELQFVLTHQSIKIEDERDNDHPMGEINFLDR
jgi:CheY-specific phosphatase CheX